MLLSKIKQALRYLALALPGVVAAAPPLDGVPVQGWGNHPAEGASYAPFAGSLSMYTEDMIMLADGSSVLAGGYPAYQEGGTGIRLGLIRLDANGIPVTSFGTNGYVKKPDIGPIFADVILKADANGKLLTLALVSGPQVNICRFDAATGATAPFTALQNPCITIPNHYGLNLVVQPDGKLLVAAYYVPPSSPKNVGDPHPDGIALPNTNFHVMRFNANGSPDQSYGQAGVVTLSPGPVDVNFFDRAPMALTSNNKLLVVVLADDRSRLYRLTDKGVPDGGWSAAAPRPGLTDYDYTELAPEPRTGSTEDDVVLLGHDNTNGDSFIARLRGTTGERDATFGTEGGYSTIGGEIVHFSPYLARRDGGGYFVIPSMSSSGCEFLPAFSFFVFALDRYGRPDPDFSQGGVFALPLQFDNNCSNGLAVHGNALYVAGYVNNGDSWYQTKLGIDRIFADGFGGLSE